MDKNDDGDKSKCDKNNVLSSCFLINPMKDATKKDLRHNAANHNTETPPAPRGLVRNFNYFRN